ncbi:hypothetical protein MSG28_012338, partial [Choristoneura fumiferana]
MKILNEFTKEKLAPLKPFLPYGVLESWEDLDPRLYHAVHIYWLKFYGLWYNTVSKCSFRFWTQIVYGFLVLWLVCFLPGIGEVVYLLRRRDNIGEIAEGLYLFLSEMYTYIKLSALWLKKNEIIDLLEYLHREEFKPSEPEHREILRKSIKTARMIYYKPATCIIDGVMDTILSAFIASAIGQIEILAFTLRNFNLVAERRRKRFARLGDIKSDQSTRYYIEKPMSHPIQIAWMAIYLTCMLIEVFIICWFGDELIWKLLHTKDYAEIAAMLFESFDNGTFMTNINEPISIEPALTEMGMCHVINSNVAVLHNPIKWKDEAAAYVKNNIEISAHDVDFYTQIMNYAEVYKVYVHSPDEIAISTTPSFTYEAEGLLLFGYQVWNHEKICDFNELLCVIRYKNEIIRLAPSNDTIAKFGHFSSLPRSSSDCGCLGSCEAQEYLKDQENFLAQESTSKLRIAISTFPRYRITDPDFVLEEPRYERAYNYFQSLVADCSEKETHDALNNAACKNHEEVSLGMLMSILTEPHNATKCYRDLTLITRDGLTCVLNNLSNLILERELRTTVRETFKEFCSNGNGEGASGARDDGSEELPREPDEPAFSDDEEDAPPIIAEDTDDDDLPLSEVRARERPELAAALPLNLRPLAETLLDDRSAAAATALLNACSTSMPTATALADLFTAAVQEAPALRITANPTPAELDNADYEDKVGDLVSVLLSTRYPGTSPNKRKRPGKHSIPPNAPPSAELVLGHLEQMRVNCVEQDDMSIFNMECMQKSLQLSQSNSSDSLRRQYRIHVKFKGEAHTEWHESKEEQTSDGKSETRDTTHTGNEEYFQISYYLLGSSNVPLVGMAGQAAPSAPPPAQYSPTQPAVLPLGPGEQVLPN